MPSGSFSKKARNRSSITNKKNCGGNKKGGLAPRATGPTEFRNVFFNTSPTVNFKISKGGLPCPESYSNNPGGQCSGGVSPRSVTRGCRNLTMRFDISGNSVRIITLQQFANNNSGVIINNAGEFEVIQNTTIANRTTLKIAQGETLRVNARVINNGTIQNNGSLINENLIVNDTTGVIIEDSGTTTHNTNSGVIVHQGKITVTSRGSFVNDGRIHYFDPGSINGEYPDGTGSMHYQSTDNSQDQLMWGEATSIHLVGGDIQTVEDLQSKLNAGNITLVTAGNTLPIGLLSTISFGGETSLVIPSEDSGAFYRTLRITEGVTLEVTHGAIDNSADANQFGLIPNILNTGVITGRGTIILNQNNGIRGCLENDGQSKIYDITIINRGAIQSPVGAIDDSVTITDGG